MDPHLVMAAIGLGMNLAAWVVMWSSPSNLLANRRAIPPRTDSAEASTVGGA